MKLTSFVVRWISTKMFAFIELHSSPGRASHLFDSEDVSIKLKLFSLFTSPRRLSEVVHISKVCYPFICSVKTDLMEIGANSTLLVAKVNKTDSGNYTCSIGESQPYTVLVHVLNGKMNRPSSLWAFLFEFYVFISKLDLPLDFSRNFSFWGLSISIH